MIKKLRFVKFQIFALSIIIGGFILLIFIYALYLGLKDQRVKFFKAEARSVYKIIRSNIIKDISINKIGFSWQNELINAIQKSDYDYLKKISKYILKNDDWIGVVFISQEKIIYKYGEVPKINYPSIVSFPNTTPEKAYTYKVGSHFLGFVPFSICEKDNINCLKDSGVVTIFDWNKIFSKYALPFHNLKIEFKEKLPSSSLFHVSLKDGQNNLQGFIVFTLAPWKFEIYIRKGLLFMYILIVALAFFTLFYVYYQSSIIYRIAREFEWQIGLKEKETRKKVKKYIKDLMSLKGEINLETLLERIFGATAVYRIYRNTIESAIKTKDLKVTLTVLANNLKSELSAKSWSILLIPDNPDEWSYFLWSENMGNECLDNILNKLKIMAVERFKEIKRKKEVLFTKNIQEDETWVSDSCLLKPIVSLVHVPMIVNNNVVAVLCLDWAEEKEFSEKEKIILNESKALINSVLESAYDLQDMFWLSYKDPMLGIYNRRILEDIEKKPYERYILFMDVDNFKQMNDKYGHEKGDEILKDITKIIKENIRDNDILLRYGGDEFIVCMKTNSEDVVKKVKERIKSAVKDQFAKYNIGISIGVSRVKANESLEDAIKEADEKMYMEKKSNKNFTS